MGAAGRFAPATLIRAVLAARLLKDQARLQEVARHLAQMFVPDCNAHALLQRLQAESCELPSSSTVWRAQLTLDLAYMRCFAQTLKQKPFLFCYRTHPHREAQSGS